MMDSPQHKDFGMSSTNNLDNPNATATTLANSFRCFILVLDFVLQLVLIHVL